MQLEKGKGPKFPDGQHRIGENLVTMKGGKIASIDPLPESEELLKVSNDLEKANDRVGNLEGKFTEMGRLESLLKEKVAQTEERLSEALEERDNLQVLLDDKVKELKAVQEHLSRSEARAIEAELLVAEFRKDPEKAKFTTFKVGDQKYQFTCKAFLWEGRTITAEDAAKNQNLLLSLIDKRAGIIQPIN